MKKLSLLLFFLCPLMLQAQTLTGRLIDSSDQSALIGANLLLTSMRDTTINIPKLTDGDGSFSFPNLKPGRYRLQANYVGYERLTRFVTIEANQDKNLGNIFMKLTATTGEIEIIGRIPPATQKGDTTEYNSAAYKTNPDASAEDLVQKMPGVTMQNGEIQAQGEKVQKVLVDGKPVFGDDPSAALKNLPADAVDKVQVFDQKSDQAQFTGFDDGENVKTINIITKPKYRNGSFGNAYAGYGTDDRYKAGGVINNLKDDRRIMLIAQSNNINQQNFASEDLAGAMGGGNMRGGRGGMMRGGWGGNSDFMVNTQSGISTSNAVGLNYNDFIGKKIEISASYFFNQSHNVANSTLLREYFLSQAASQVYNQEQSAISDNYNHRFNARLTYNIDSNNSLLIIPRFSYQTNRGSRLTSAITRAGDNLLNSSDIDFNSDYNSLSMNNRLLFQHKFSKEGRTISLRLDQDYKSTEGNNSLFSENLFYDENGFDSDTLRQSANLDQFDQSYEADLTYTEPLGKNFQLQLEYEAEYSKGNSDKQTYQSPFGIENKTLILDSALTNTYNTTYFTQQAGTGIRYNKEKLMFSAEVNFQRSTLTSDQTFPRDFDLRRDFTNILPMAHLRYTPSKSKSMGLFYRTRTSPPSVQQLQNVLDNSNPIQLYLGNAGLTQQYEHRLFTRYSSANTDKSTMFFAMLGGNYTTNYVGNSVYTPRRDTIIDGVYLQQGTQLTRPVNLDGYWNVFSHATYGFPVGLIKSKLNFNAMARIGHQPGLLNDQLNYAWTPTLGLGATLSSNISEKLDFTLSSNSSMSYIRNTLNKQSNTQYFNQTSSARLYWNPWKDLVYRTDLTHQLYTGLSSGFNQNYLLWNMSLGMKVFKKKQGEIQLSVYDLLRQNNSISRTITETYYEDVQTNVLQRYFMATFLYRIRHFKDGGDAPVPDAPSMPSSPPHGPPPGR